MGTVRRYQTGAYIAGERSVVMTSDRHRAGAPVVLVIPGVSADAWTYCPDDPTAAPAWWRGLTMLAEAGAVVCSGTFADTADGGSSWGNQPGRDRMDLALDMLAGSPYNADTTRVGIIGDSEGGVLGLNYLWRHTDTVRAIATRLTPPHVQPLYDGNSLVADLIDDAFDTLGGWAANAETHDPSSATNIPLVAAVADRVRMYYSTDDGLAPEADHLTYAAATGVEVVSLGPVQHDIRTTGAVQPETQAAWIWARLAA